MNDDLRPSPFVGSGQATGRDETTSFQRFGLATWSVLTVLVFGIAGGLTYRPGLSGMDLAVTIAAPICALGVVMGLLREVRPGLGSAATVATGVAIAAFGVLMFAADEWSFVTFVLYAAAFGCGPRLGTVFAFAISVLWAAGWLADGAPAFAVVIPMAVFVVASLLARTIYQVQIANERQADLIDELAASRRDLATSEHRKGTLEERARVSAEIHDTLAQGFTSIVLLSRSGLRAGHDLDVLRSIEATALDNLDAARRLVEASGPVELNSSTLIDALQDEVRDRFAPTAASRSTASPPRSGKTTRPFCYAQLKRVSSTHRLTVGPTRSRCRCRTYRPRCASTFATMAEVLRPERSTIEADSPAAKDSFRSAAASTRWAADSRSNPNPAPESSFRFSCRNPILVDHE